MYNKKKEKNGIHRILIYRDKRLEIYTTNRAKFIPYNGKSLVNF